jgi:hypothetical protein
LFFVFSSLNPFKGNDAFEYIGRSGVIRIGSKTKSFPQFPNRTAKKGLIMIIVQAKSAKMYLAIISIILPINVNIFGQDAPPTPKPVPRLQVVPMPYYQASFQRDGVEIARYYFAPDLNRPFVFPVIGPSGKSLTRMGHPHDPDSHSHHNSVWISHTDVNGIDFWSDIGKGKIRHKRIIKIDDSNESSSIVTENEWVSADGKVLLSETRQVMVLLLENSEWLLIIDTELRAADKTITFGKTPFGLLGVRTAKTIGVNDGGGTIRNSEGGVNEKEIFWKRAKWVDYSGPITSLTTRTI